MDAWAAQGRAADEQVHGALEETHTALLEQRLSMAGLSEAASRAVRVLSMLYHLEPALPHSPAVPAGAVATATPAAGACAPARMLQAVAPEALQSRKLTRKLSLVLSDAVSVASGSLPLWCHLLPSLCPFLFSFSTREQLVKCTAFGTSQTIFWLQEHRIDPDGVLRRRLREAEKIDDLIAYFKPG